VKVLAVVDAEKHVKQIRSKRDRSHEEGNPHRVIKPDVRLLPSAKGGIFNIL